MVKTRRVRRSDGRVEIHRVLTFDGLAESKMDDPLAFEKMIVWVEDPSSWSFVRESVITNATSRRGPLHVAGVGRVVGYSKLTADAPSMDGKYVRRIFYLKQDDAAHQDVASELPRNAVDPNKIVPGSAGDRLAS